MYRQLLFIDLCMAYYKDHGSEVVQSICYDKPVFDSEWSLNNLLLDPLRAEFSLQQGT